MITTRLGTSFFGKRKLTIQERFVRNMRDSITIQTISGSEGELFHLGLVSQFIYGEYNGTDITDLVIIQNTTVSADATFDEKIRYTTNVNSHNRTVFIATKLKEFDRNNIPYT
ncbi:hypothetical protein [Bacillus mobilis]|uniref:hypothetical protein n=1 Tax=Bacillus mobilis TaxID=2026190 RepID=UPI0013D52E8E|nr:hypothetical protein [Bacillus mobilis]NEL00332.1 hypothetical protein [Bacillus mobilis]